MRLIRAVIIILLIATVGWLVFLNFNQRKLSDAKFNALQKQISNLQSITATIASSSRATSAAISTQELTNRAQVIQKSQDQLLTSAIEKAGPAVVSIIISQNAPQYQVECLNPFGDDPFFQGSNFCIPSYKQIGTQLQKTGAGSGLIISKSGYIVTNRHVVSDVNAQYTVLISNGKQEQAQVIYRDPNTDIAIIKINTTPPKVASIGDSSSIKLGQTVAAIGNALGEYNNSVSVGIVSGLNRTITAQDNLGRQETLQNVIQTDAAINPGNSGGPLIDLNGNVVGINVATVEGSNSIGFSIPINSVSNIIAQYR